MKKTSFILLLFLLSCNFSENEKSKFRKTDNSVTTKKSDSIQYIYDKDAEWLIEVSNKGGTTTQKRYYKWSIDTSYFENGKPSMATVVVDAGSGNYIHSEFYRNGQLNHKWEEAGVNGGIATTVEYFYDSTGILVSKNNFKYGNGTYHETHVTLETIEYYANGKMKIKKFSEYFFGGNNVIVAFGNTTMKVVN